VIGFVGLDNIGLEGIEREYDRYMHGSLKIVTTQKDRKGRNLNPMDLDYNYTTRGNDVVLTIDEVLQNIAEKELETACLKWESNGGSVIIMEPKTGKILAVANYPTYDLNNAFSAGSDYMRNRAFIDLYEPGSAFKIITASALINENLVNTNDSIYCENGFYNINGRIVHDSEGYGSLTFGEVLEKSSNIGMVKFASRLSGEKFYEYIKAFGLNEKTGAGIPETIGFIKSIADWTGYSMGTIPYGHEISVTAIQMLSAVNAIANDGIIMKPYIIQSIMSGDSSIMESKPTQFKNPISKRTASIMRDLLTMAVKNGTGRNAQVEGYSVAGKTGTSQKSAGYGKGYMPGKYVSSFVGLLPVENPLISMIVIIDEPKGSYYGGTVACPVFKNIAEQSMQYLKISQGVKLVANY